MFVLTQSKTYEWPVKIPDPMDGGKFREQEIPFIFNRLTKKELDDLSKSSLSNEDFFERVIVGWKEGSVHDENGAVPYSKEAFNLLLNRFLPASNSIIRAFYDSVSESLRKN